MDAAEQRKTVTIVACAAMHDDDLDVEVTRRREEAIRARIAQAFQQWGGTLVDVGSSKWVGLFGVPFMSEDDASRGTLAALHLRDRISGDPVTTVRCGVATGECIVNLDEKGQWSATGSAVYRGLELAQLVEGPPVVMDEDTARRLGDAVTAGSFEEIELNHVGTVKAAEVVSIDRPSDRYERIRDIPIVAREQEMGALERVLSDATSAGSWGRVTLVGPPGAGKSHLLRAFLRDHGRQTTVLVLRCPAHARGGALRPFGSAVGRWAGVDDEDRAETAALKIDAALGRIPDRDVVAAALLQTLELDASEVALETAVYALRAWLQSLQAPLIVVVEDVHWAQGAFIDAIDHILLQWSGASILLIATTRPEFLDRHPEWGLVSAQADTITLQPLGPEALGEIAAHLLSPLHASPTLLEKVATATKGNPLFAAETLSMLAREDLLVETGAGLDTDEQEIPLPQSLTDVIQARIDRLFAADQEVLSTAAVLGGRFSSSDLAAAGGSSAEEVMRTVMSLVRKDVFEAILSPEDEASFIFRHDLIREVAYARLPRARRAEGHIACGEMLAQRHAVDNTSVGRHFARAVEELGAVDPRDERLPQLRSAAAMHLAAAGRAALDLGDITTGIEQLRRALEHWDPSAPDFYPVAFDLVHALADAGDNDEAQRLLETIGNIEGAQDEHSVSARCEIESMLIRMKTAPSSSEVERSEAERALALADVLEQAGDHSGVGRAYERIAQRHAMEMNYSATEKALETLLAKTSAVPGTRRQEARAITFLASCAFWGPKPAREAAARCRELIAASRGNLYVESRVMTNLAGLEAMLGNIDKARSLIEDSFDVLERMGDVAWKAGSYHQVGVIEILARDWERAEAELRAGLDLQRQVAVSFVDTTLYFLARVLFEQERYDEAVAAVEAAWEGGSQDDAAIAEWGGTLAKIHAQRGDIARARELIAGALGVIGSTDGFRDHGDLLMDAAYIAEIEGQIAKAGDLVGQAIAMYDRKESVASLRYADEIAARLRAG